MRGKRLKEKLRAGRPVFTTPLKFHAPRLVEMLGRSGVDQVFLDAEHGPLTEGECEEMVRAADLHDLPVAIRVPVNAPEVILRYLDIGTSAIMVPHVTTRADAEGDGRRWAHGSTVSRARARPGAGVGAAPAGVRARPALTHRETVKIVGSDPVTARRRCRGRPGSPIRARTR